MSLLNSKLSSKASKRNMSRSIRSKENKMASKWTQEEKFKLSVSIFTHGTCWNKIAEVMGTRTPAACRQQNKRQKHSPLYLPKVSKRIERKRDAKATAKQMLTLNKLADQYNSESSEPIRSESSELDIQLSFWYRTRLQKLAMTRTTTLNAQNAQINGKLTPMKKQKKYSIRSVSQACGRDYDKMFHIIYNMRIIQLAKEYSVNLRIQLKK